MHYLEYPAFFNVYTKEAASALSAEFFNHQACRDWFISLTFPSGPHCPACKTKITDTNTLKNFSALRRCQCKSCNHWFTAKSGTILQDSKITVTEFYLLCLLLELKVPAAGISRILKISTATVSLWQKKIKLHTEALNE